MTEHLRRRGGVAAREQVELAENLRRVLRAVRVSKGFRQTRLAKELEVSQGYISKLESGELIPDVPFWFSFCRKLGVSADSINYGVIDTMSKALLLHGRQENGFELPVNYSQNRGMKVRAIAPLLSFASRKLGEESINVFFLSSGVQTEFFTFMDNQINFNLFKDFLKFARKKNLFRPASFAQLKKVIAEDRFHGDLGKQYRAFVAPFDRVEHLVKNSRFYSCDFIPKIQDKSDSRIEVSVSPGSHMENFSFDEELKDFLPNYKKAFLEGIGNYRGDSKIEFTIKKENSKSSGEYTFIGSLK